MRWDLNGTKFERLVGGVGSWRDFGEDVGEEFNQDLQAFLGIEMIHSLLQGLQLLVYEVLQDRPQLPGELVGGALLSSSELLACGVGHTTPNYCGLRTVRDGGGGAFPSGGGQGEQIGHQSLFLQGIAESQEFIDVLEEGVREVARFGYKISLVLTGRGACFFLGACGRD